LLESHQFPFGVLHLHHKVIIDVKSTVLEGLKENFQRNVRPILGQISILQRRTDFPLQLDYLVHNQYEFLQQILYFNWQALDVKGRILTENVQEILVKIEKRLRLDTPERDRIL
jgi:hypothetical protein